MIVDTYLVHWCLSSVNNIQETILVTGMHCVCKIYCDLEKYGKCKGGVTNFVDIKKNTHTHTHMKPTCISMSFV